MSYMCPACGYGDLDEPPRSTTGGGSYEICPCCSFQFGVSDDDRGYSFESWRRNWVEAGMPWDQGRTAPPSVWDAAKQLDSVGVGDARQDLRAAQVAAESEQESPMKRLYADFNDIAADGTLPLTCKGSVDSIAALGEKLRTGEEVMLFNDEMEVIARVFWFADGSWEARADWRILRPVASRSGQ